MTIMLGLASHGIRMTPETFDNADYDECYRYQLINGVVLVSDLASCPEADANEELGCWLRNYGVNHAKGKLLVCTLPNHLVGFGGDRRLVNRAIWAGLGRLPRKGETPTVVVEFVSSRKLIASVITKRNAMNTARQRSRNTGSSTVSGKS